MMIDAHHHFWNPARGDYDWMPDLPVLNRPYGPGDLAPALSAAGIEGTVLVQAAATAAETDYMLGLADASPFVLGVVGWIDFEDPGQIATLRRWANHPKFRGVRPMIQDIEDVNWMLREDVQWAYEALIDLDLSFDALGFPHHLENFHRLLTRYPDLRVVIDHIMKPQIRDQMAGRDAFSGWAKGMEKLANETSACVKFSAMVTEAAPDWSIEDLRPFAMHVLNVFGPERTMWGSDWPVCRVRAEYETWFETARTLCETLDPAARAQVFGETARRFYRLG